MNQLSFTRALELYQEKNYLEAFNILKEIENEDLLAKTLLGVCYINGEGTKIDFNAAFKCFSEASLHQEEGAYWYLGYVYEMGYGTSQNDLQAILWYKNSAKLGKPNSMYDLGRLYLKYDRAEAILWLTKAQDLGSVEAMLLLAAIYNQDGNKALMLKSLELASKAKNPKALFELGKYYLNKEHLKPTLAKDYLVEAAHLGYEEAFLVLGKELISGEILAKNEKEALVYSKLAYNNHLKGSDILLANAYYYGYGTKVDFTKARDILELSARENNSDAIYVLGLFYENEKSQYHDLDIALYWYERAAILGNIKAMLRLASCYENKIGVPKADLDKSYRLLERAASAGSIEASCRLKAYKKNIFGHYHLVKE